MLIKPRVLHAHHSVAPLRTGGGGDRKPGGPFESGRRSFAQSGCGIPIQLRLLTGGVAIRQSRWKGGIKRWASDTWNRDRDLNLQGWTWKTWETRGLGLDLDLGRVHTSSAGRCQGSVWQLEFAAGSVALGMCVC